jgi:hypothetical protein
MTSYNTKLVENGQKIFEIISQFIYNTQNDTIRDYIHIIVVSEDPSVRVDIGANDSGFYERFIS